jgi:hypothetical protein
MSELLKINVNDHTERKNGLTYLSWAWAWAEVLKLDPAATHEVHEYAMENGVRVPCCFLPDGSAMVKVSVTIKGDRKTMNLPVMDHRNKAIKSPDAFAVNTAVMRCLAKAIAMHGLGLYIYAGEDLPETDEQAKVEPEPAKQRTGVAADVLATGPALLAEEVKYLDELAAEVLDLFKLTDGAKLCFERVERDKLDDMQKVYLSSRLPSNVRNPIKKYSQQYHASKKEQTA